MNYMDLVNLASIASAHKKNLDKAISAFDERREPIADAAQFLHCDHGFTANWLRHHEAISITRYAGDLRALGRQQVAMMRLFEPPVFQADSFGVVMNGELYEPSGDGWSFKIKYTDREKVADAARFLWKNQHSGGWVEQLIRMSPKEILRGGEGRQERLCKEVADAAWKCIDSGDWKAHHFIYCVVSNKRILEAAEAIKDCQGRAIAKAVKIRGTLNLEGYGEHGGGVKVEGIPVFDDCEPFSLDIESEFMKRSAKTYGITGLTNANFCPGPGIYL